MAPDILSLVLLLAASLLPPEHTRAREVRSLPVREAQTGRRVHLSGVVTFCPPPHGYFYLQDDTAGVRVEWPKADLKLKPGNVVELRGVTTGGTFLPEVKANWVRVKGDAEGLPQPTPFNLTLEDAAYLDGQWVEVEAVVQRAWTYEGWLQLDLARGRGNAIAMLPLPLPSKVQKAELFSGAVVKVRGVCRPSTNANRHVIGPARIFVTDLSEFKLIKDPPEDPFALPLTTATDLTRFRPNPIEARLQARVSGIVTLSHNGRHLLVQDDTGVVNVTCTNDGDVKVGQRVTAVGFPRLGAEPIRLDNSQVLVTDPNLGRLPVLANATVAEAATGKLDGRVVTFVGTVLDAGRQSNWPTLNLVVDGTVFTVVLLDPDATVEPGSKVEVTGVVTKQQFDNFRPHTFAVIVRTNALKVLEGPPRPPESPPPSWWTTRRVAYLMAGFLGLFLAGGAGATVLRLQVRRATALVRKECAEKEKLEGQLKLAAKLEAVGRLASSIAHDFNNLLTVINGCAFLLDKEIVNDPDRAAKLAGAIRRAGDQAAALTRQLLTFSRQRPVNPQPLDLNEVLTNATDILERLLGDRITIGVTTTPGLPLAMAETGQLSQILLNLAVNAADAMPNGGTFTLATTLAEPGWVRLTATDTGTGMTDEVKAHVFERGFTTKGADKGTGLGLSTIYNIVQKLGGRIRFTSELGRGTTFEVDLPVAGSLPAALPAPAPPPAEIAIKTTASVSVPPLAPVLSAAVVMLVEDEEAVCTLLRHVLEHAGLTVLAASEPEEALQLLGQYRGTLDLLVTDVVLPGLSGRQLADRVRLLQPGVKVLFMSGYTADEILLRGILEEQVDFLHKPFLPRELIEQVTRLLAQPTA